ncbi:hypothetical protein BGZ96_001626 [Linnemannia gamsii]|uniref:Copper transporter n=1 Tax=Linnemannia gamsii TaxID=64522 RepID=A0ABQ7K9V2_9FUNG|nr:hypothetical protein BGZ96_001626 [Linnemannia gamsii]
MNSGTLTILPADPLEQVLVVEIKITDTKVIALMCYGGRQEATQAPRIVCTHTTTSVLITKAQSMNSDILQRLPNNSFRHKVYNLTSMLSLEHLPSVTTDQSTFDIPKILNASSVATDFFASLGQNFFLDWERSTLYVVYDTVDIIKGYEVPRWLFWTMVGVMVGCLAFWGATEYWVEAKYKRSLYFAVSKELTTGQNNAKPRLHKFDPKTLRFEGKRIVSTEAEQMPEQKTGAVQSSVHTSRDALVTAMVL